WFRPTFWLNSPHTRASVGLVSMSRVRTRALRTSLWRAFRSFARLVTVSLHGFAGTRDAVLPESAEQRLHLDGRVAQVPDHGVRIGWLQREPLVKRSRVWSECCEFFGQRHDRALSDNRCGRMPGTCTVRLLVPAEGFEPSCAERTRV